ncbi:MAG: hypothetical protein ABDH29_04190 [Aquificaceae bacterium]
MTQFRQKYVKVLAGTITIQAKLTFENGADKQKVLDLMRRWSSCTRYAYNRLIEGHERNQLKRELQGIFGLKAVQNLESKPERVLKPLGGTSFDARNLWQVLKVAVVTPLSPDRVLRNLSVLKSLLVSGQVGKAFEGRKFLFLGTGAMALSNTACWGLREPEEAEYKYPSQTVQFCAV